MEILSLLVGTVLLRPYVFIFLALFLFLASRQVGRRRALLWTLTGYAVAWTAEYASTHWGIPFGDYYYIDATRDRELWIGGVPFMDSLSFAFLSYTGYACAWQIAAALTATEGRPPAPDAYLGARRSWRTLLLGAGITTLMDVIIDPVSLMGDRWFLGLIYGYPHGGCYFGVPVANFVGWAVVSAAIIGLNQAWDRLLPPEVSPEARRPLAYEHLGGFLLFFFIVAFNLSVAAWLRAWALFLTGTCLVTLFFAAAFRLLARNGMLVRRLPSS